MRADKRRRVELPAPLEIEATAIVGLRAFGARSCHARGEDVALPMRRRDDKHAWSAPGRRLKMVVYHIKEFSLAATVAAVEDGVEPPYWRFADRHV